MYLRKSLAGLTITGLVLFSGGCASTRPVPYAGIESSRYLRPNDESRGDRMPYAYQARQVDWKRYSRVMLDPVRVYAGSDSQFEKISEHDKKMLAGYMSEQFREALAHRYWFSPEPGPETLRVRLTLTGAKPTTKVIGTVMKVDLAGGPYNAVQAARGREGAFIGSVSYSVEILDAHTDELLAAYVEKQYPNAMNFKASLGSLDAAKAGIRKGAEELTKKLW
ncbi:MAG TPA: DUF3313 domain-containing protein [Xanthomonadaceae bacterium]|nr:DUF3313 domain-containing protein [Xanthomonadaceae bacterium]